MSWTVTLPWPSGFEIAAPVIVLGLIVGLSYAILALGIVLVYKSSRVINLAHGEVGAVAAVVLALLVRDHEVSYLTAFVVALGVAAGLGALIELTVVRRLFRAPRLVLLVATMGVAQLLLVVTNLVTETIDNRIGGYPLPFQATVSVGDLLILNAGHLMILVAVPLVALALTAFFRYSPSGVAVRAAAENEDSARLIGVSVRRLSTLVWMVAAVLSAITAILLAPGRALVTTESLGPGLLVRALAAAVIARMTSLPIAFAAGIGIGVVEQVVFWNRPTGGVVELVLFAVILGALLLQHRSGLRDEERSSWTVAHIARRAAAATGWTRAAGPVAVGAVFTVGAVLPFFLRSSQVFLLTTIVAFAILALSITVLTGYAGQLSLGQVGFFGVGAAVSYQMSVEIGIFFWMALLGAGAAGAAGSVLIGIPALRIRGAFLAVTTLGFALLAQQWLLGQTWMAGVGVRAPRPLLGPIDLEAQTPYYLFALGCLAAALWVTRNLIRGAVGRTLVAVRDNEPGAAAFAVSPVRAKLTAFAVSGFLAGFAGAIYGHGIERFGVQNFPVSDSLRVVSMAVIGGLVSLPGTLAGVFFVLGIDRLVHVPYLQMLTTSVGVLIVLMFVPGGLAQAGRWIADGAVRAVGIRRREPEIEIASPSEADGTPKALTFAGFASPDGHRSEGPILSVSDMAIHFGGVNALTDVALEIEAGSVVGLIGPNGAGKTTLIDCIGGFIRPDRGVTVFEGQDVSGLPPQARAQRGLVRSFQDGRLFGELTVTQTLLLASERHARSKIGHEAFMTPPARSRERRAHEEAETLIERMHLAPYRDGAVRDLSTGTRRVVELAAMLMLAPTVLLLDEPSAGLAQKEAEALGALLRRIQEATGTTMLVVEHDMPLIMGLADEIVAMDAGRVIARDTPKKIRKHPDVVASYLGAPPTARRQRRSRAKS